MSLQSIDRQLRLVLALLLLAPVLSSLAKGALDPCGCPPGACLCRLLASSGGSHDVTASHCYTTGGPSMCCTHELPVQPPGAALLPPAVLPERVGIERGLVSQPLRATGAIVLEAPTTPPPSPPPRRMTRP